MENKIDYEQKNIEDYKKLSELLYLYHSGKPLTQGDLNIIAQASQKQRIEAMNLRLQQQAFGVEFGTLLENNNEELGNAMFKFYYGSRSELTKEQLFLIATASDEEKLSSLESYIRTHLASPYAAISSIGLINEERKNSKSK